MTAAENAQREGTVILVVGSTGQLGTAIVQRLASSGREVRAFVRPTSDTRHVRIRHVDLSVGDLRDAASVDRACTGAHVVIATANTVVPRGRYSFSEDEEMGYRNLIAASKRQGVRQFVLMSVPVTPHDDAVPTFRLKRWIERLLVDSGIEYAVFRGAPFMEEWFALLGSSIPLRGCMASTLDRPFWFARLFRGLTGQLIERRGLALVLGSGETRHAFISLDNVADFLVNAVSHGDARNRIFEIGGPELLSWNEVVALFAKVLGRAVRGLHAPAGVFKAQQAVLAHVSPAAANLMGLNWAVGTSDTLYDTRELASKFGIRLTRAEDFLRAKLAMNESAA